MLDWKKSSLNDANVINGVLMGAGKYVLIDQNGYCKSALWLIIFFGVKIINQFSN